MLKKKNIQQNLIITVLLQTLGKTSTAVVTKKGDDLLQFLNEVLRFANTELEKDEIYYSDLTPEEAEHEIKILDGLYNGLDAATSILVEMLTDEEVNQFRAEYNRLINNMEDLREALEIFADEEAMQTLREVAKGDFSNFVEYNSTTFWNEAV